jgi:hypothetical protein
MCFAQTTLAIYREAKGMIAIEELYGDACRLVQCLHVKQERPHLKFSCTGTVGKEGRNAWYCYGNITVVPLP